jgi:hypothetical protein
MDPLSCRTPDSIVTGVGAQKRRGARARQRRSVSTLGATRSVSYQQTGDDESSERPAKLNASKMRRCGRLSMPTVIIQDGLAKERGSLWWVETPGAPRSERHFVGVSVSPSGVGLSVCASEDRGRKRVRLQGPAGLEEVRECRGLLEGVPKLGGVGALEKRRTASGGKERRRPIASLPRCLIEVRPSFLRLSV